MNRSRTSLQEAARDRGSVSISFVRAALSGLRRRGGDPQALSRRLGIPESLLEAEESRVSARSFGDLWLAISQELDDELFGMDERRMKVGSFAALCHATARSSNLAEALGLAVRLFNILMDDASLQLIRVEGLASLRITERGARDLGFARFAHETVLVMVHGLMCWLAGRRIRIHSTAFAYPRPAWWREYVPMFSTELSFDAGHSELAFDERVLETAVDRDARSVRRFLREAPYNFIVKFKDQESVSVRIRRRLRTVPPSAWPGVSALASELGMATSTLHRKLEREGMSFREIRDGLRRDLAIARLTHTSLSVAQVAVEVGFAEPSAFHRAFKLWTGVRPGDYRRRLAPPGNAGGESGGNGGEPD